MAATPYDYLRGSAIVMASDVAKLPATGISPIICGDAHLGNFGFYASPERHLVIDLNDFDEAHPGRWEWDLRRLAVSIWLVGRQNTVSEADCELAVERCVAAYRKEIRQLATQPLLARSYEQLNVDRLAQLHCGRALRGQIARAAYRARQRTGDRALPHLTAEHADGQRRIIHHPPLVMPVRGNEADLLGEALDSYLTTLAPHWRRALGGYTLVDIAHKVVGIGSVGLRPTLPCCKAAVPTMS